jgi:hypothetical protein
MEDAIEVEIAVLPGGVASSDMRVVGRMRLTPRDGGGHRIYVHSGEDATFWESRGFLAARTESVWHLIAKAAAWAAAEWEKRS